MGLGPGTGEGVGQGDQAHGHRGGLTPTLAVSATWAAVRRAALERVTLLSRATLRWAAFGPLILTQTVGEARVPSCWAFSADLAAYLNVRLRTAVFASGTTATGSRIAA